MVGRRNAFIFAGAVIALIAAGGIFRTLVSQPIIIDSENVIVDQAYRLQGTVDDALFVVSPSIDLDAGSRVAGDAALIGETVTVNGQVDGDLTVTGDSLIIGANATINGDVVLLVDDVRLDGKIAGELTISGQTFAIAPAAQVSGEVAACVNTITDARSQSAIARRCGDSMMAVNLFRVFEQGVHQSFAQSAFIAFVSSLLLSLLLSGLATLAVTIFPRHISYIEEAIRVMPRALTVTGLMTFVGLVGLAAAFIVLLALIAPLGLLLLPLVFIGLLALLVMILTGLITVAIVFGDWLLNRRSRGHWPPLVSAAVGSVALSVLLHLPMFIPYGVLVTLALVILLSTIAVGAALTTRMGTRPLRRSQFVQG